MKYASKYDLDDEVFYVDGRSILKTKINTITIKDSLYKGGMQVDYSAGINGEERIFKEQDLYQTKIDAKNYLIKWVESL